MGIRVVRDDITTLAVDAIVNAANSSLLGGGGVDRAIHRRGGPAVTQACREIRLRQGKCATGQAVITTAGNLPARYVIHTVGPVWNGGSKDEEPLLAQCYSCCLNICVEKHIRSMAFPNISTGIYRYPKEEAVRIAMKTVINFDRSPSISEVTFVCFDDENHQIYCEQIRS